MQEMSCWCTRSWVESFGDSSLSEIEKNQMERSLTIKLFYANYTVVLIYKKIWLAELEDEVLTNPNDVNCIN